ncbi:MAG: glycosyl hydrolase-related protein [Tannerella sp.]|jgi:alpha-mannosidase|nr:glycosyl hydrolase-related protein [Tannerella sp.]
MIKNKLRTTSLLVFFMIFSSVPAQKPYKAYMVSNAHFDTQWLWTVQTSIDDYLYRTMAQNFWLFDNYPDYVFNFEGAVKYSWMKEYYPAEYERVKQYVRSGRWNVTGSTWDATDPNMPSPESFFRNILLGQEFYKQEFGLKTNDIFLPDCFGFGYALPTIAAHAGLIGFSTQKLQWRKFPFYGDKKIPFLHGIWEGLDGSRIMSILHAQSYVTRYEYEDISANKQLIQLAQADTNRVVYHYYGVGDRGGSPTIPSVASIAMGIKGEGPVEIISARAGQFYDDFYPLENHSNLPVFKGELLMDVHATGCYTSQAAMKRFNRRNEQLADLAERASVVAEWLGGLKYPAEELRNSWKRFLWHQFHDDMTGTSIPAVYTFSWNDELISQSKFAEIATTAVGTVSRALDTRVKGTPIIVYNPVAQKRKDIVTATVALDAKTVNVSVVNPDGEKMPAQILSRKDDQATIIFPADIDPVSYYVYDVVSENNATASPIAITNNSIENKVYKLTLDRNGDIASVIDKRNNNRELVKNGKAFRLALFPKNESPAWPAWELFKETIDQSPLPVSDNVRISIAEAGAVRATLKVERTYGTSVFTQYISLSEGASDDRIDITAELDWNESNALLKAEFPMNVSNERALYDLGIGYIERGNNTQTAYEVYAQQWADITNADNSYGIAIMNDCKYGWDKPDDNTLRLTLLHTPKVGNDPNMTHQDHLDKGHHTIRYSIVGHPSTAINAQVAWKSEALNQPLLSFVTSKHNGQLGKTFSFIRTNSPQIAVKAVKKAEDENSYIIRVNEIYGENLNNAEILLAAEIEEAEEVNGIEETIGTVQYDGNKITFDAKSFQPRTFSVKLKSNPVLQNPVNIYVPLEYNATAVTPDEFSKSGNFDGRGNSFAAELLPGVINSEGVEFKLNNKPNEYNYIRCNGQTIQLSAGHKATRLYLLLTSSRDDRRAVFNVGGKDYAFDIPYYSGFYGQWGWKGESEGYIKEASIAYLGTHRHSEQKGNESYTYTYLYKIYIDIDKDATSFTLPKDEGIALFAATLSDNPNAIDAAWEMRALPYTTQERIYSNVPVMNRRNR